MITDKKRISPNQAAHQAQIGLAIVWFALFVLLIWLQLS